MHEPAVVPDDGVTDRPLVEVDPIASTGVVRQTVNFLLQDQTITADEFKEFEDVMYKFRNACFGL